MGILIALSSHPSLLLTHPKFIKVISMRNLTATLCLTIAVIVGSVGVTLGKGQSVSKCSNKDREYAKSLGNSYDPEDAYEFGKKIKKLVTEKNLEGLFALVDGELTSGPPKRFISGK